MFSLLIWLFKKLLFDFIKFLRRKKKLQAAALAKRLEKFFKFIFDFYINTVKRIQTNIYIFVVFFLLELLLLLIYRFLLE